MQISEGIDLRSMCIEKENTWREEIWLHHEIFRILMKQITVEACGLTVRTTKIF